MLFLWLKALHVIAMVAWMAGLFYLPRLFVYHCAAPMESESYDTFRIMERRLYRAIMIPAMIATWVLGLSLLWISGGAELREGLWMWVKLLLALGLTGFHFLLGVHRARFAAGKNAHGERYFRAINEVPTLFLVAIVVLVIVRPV